MKEISEHNVIHQRTGISDDRFRKVSEGKRDKLVGYKFTDVDGTRKVEHVRRHGVSRGAMPFPVAHLKKTGIYEFRVTMV